jgi:DNA polymerase I
MTADPVTLFTFLAFLRQRFDRVVFCDTEFTPRDGEQPIPLTFVGYEAVSGTWLRLRQGQLDKNPFPVDERTLWVGFMWPAEAHFFLVCGWELPARVIDLYVEARNLSNKALPKFLDTDGRGLVHVLERFGLKHPHGHKKAMQDLAVRGGPYTEQEWADLLDYNESDVVILPALMECIMLHVRSRQLLPGKPRRGAGQAMLRGRYANHVGRMQYNGTPIDTETWEKIRCGREAVIEHVIERGDHQYGVFRGTTFSEGQFREYITDQGLIDDWPRTEKRGVLKVDKDVLKEQARAHPQLNDLREMLLLKGCLRESPLAVGSDGRNRTELWPFGSATGRNQPSSTKAIFGAATWQRSLIQPAEDMAVAYVDYSAEEVAIAAYLSGDPELLKAIESGDPYISFLVRAGLVPDGSTKATHKKERDIAKVAVLGMNYGLQPPSLARGTGLTLMEAQKLHRQLQKIYDRYWEWSQGVINAGLLRGELYTYFGWRAQVVEGVKATTLKNFPAQAHGSEILRLACCLIAERGITLCAPVHDAVLIEARADDIDEAVAVTQACMAEASRVVLGGYEIRTDAEIIRYPDRYMDSRGQRVWELVTEVLE